MIIPRSSVLNFSFGSVISLLIICIAEMGFSQSGTWQISGKIVDGQTQSPLAYSTARLLSRADSSFILGSLADEQGLFQFESTPDSYLLQLEYIGYQPKLISIDYNEQAALELGEIGLEFDSEQIEEVEVRAKKSETTYHLDKKVFTVGSDLTAMGTNAIDVLADVPSVSTDIDGTVSLRGSEGVQILINGKPSGLTGLSTTNALKNIPASQIDRVEVITNPSARYDAQGQVGIINIILKKERKSGWNGSFDFYGGFPKNLGTSVNMNYRKQKFNLFSTLGLSTNTRPGQGYAWYQYYQPEQGIYFSSNDRDFERQGLSYNGQLGLEYFISEQQFLTGSIGYTIGDDENETSIIYSNYDEHEVAFNERLRTDMETEDEEDLQYNLNYLYELDKESGKKLSADFRYEQTGETEGSDYFEQTVFGETQPSISEKSLNEEQQDEYLLQIDYVNPISKTKKIEFGAKATFRDIRTDFGVDRLQANGWYEPVTDLTNQFAYDENISAIYGIYANENGRFSYQLGLRGEYTDIVTELKETNEVNARDYVNLFPSVFLNYKTEKDYSFQLSYSRRFERPRFWFLNPFLTYSDARRRFTGNPNLNPEFTNSFELGVLKEWEKTTVNSAVYLRHTTDVIRRLTFPQEADTVVIMPVNLNSMRSGGFELTVNSDITKWWTVDGSFDLFYFDEDGKNINSSYVANDVTWMSRFTSSFNFPNDFSGQIRAFYRAPRTNTQGKRKSMYSIDLATAKEILNKKGSITASVRDLFNSRKRQGILYTDRYYSEDEFQWRSRSVTIGFSYRINQQKRRQNQRGDQPDGGGGEF